MKKLIVLVLTFIIPACICLAQDYDLIYFGDNRPHVPGPEKISTVFAANPALIPDAVHNALSYSFFFLPPLNLGAEGHLNQGIGQYLSVAMPNFCLMDISQTGIMLGADKSEYVLTKDLLGFQLGLALKDFVATDLLNAGLGVGLYRLRNMADTGKYSGPAESVNLDLGLTFSFAILNLEFLIRDLWVYENAESNFFKQCNYYGSLGGKVILDIEYKLGFSTAFNYPGMDFASELMFIRYFFSNALRTGISLKVFFDLESEVNKLPVVVYDLALSYTPTELLPVNKSNTDGDVLHNLRGTFWSLLYNMSFQAACEIVISNLPDRQYLKPIFTLGLVKYF